jgi:hypothetical protein
MSQLERTEDKSTTLNQHNRINNKVFVTKTFLYCNNCGKSIEKNSLFCYIFIDYFCSEKCHIKKHTIHLEKIGM